MLSAEARAAGRRTCRVTYLLTTLLDRNNYDLQINLTTAAAQGSKQQTTAEPFKISFDNTLRQFVDTLTFATADKKLPFVSHRLIN